MNENIMEPEPKRMKMGSNQLEENEIDFTEDLKDTGDKFAVSEDKYNNFVSPEEIEKLREFKVLDEVNDEDSNDEDSDSSEGKSDEELPEEELEKMLDENLPEDFKGAPKPKEKAYIIRQKTILEEKGVNQYEVLPLDWMMVRHHSGIPVYMHRATRVCTLSKPYFLGKGNTRRHDIPISAIPCYAYRRGLEEEAKQKEIDKKIEEQIKKGTWAKKVNNEAQNTDQKTTDEPVASSDVNKIADVDANTNNPNEAQLPVDMETKPSGAAELHNANDDISTSKCPFSQINVKTTQENSENQENQAENIKVTTESNVKDCDKEKNADDDAEKVEEELPLNLQPVVLPGGIVMPPPRVETVSTSWKTQHLTPEQVTEYCKSLFHFKVVNIMHFRRWADRRKYTKARKTLQFPTLPEGTKLITIPASASNSQDNGGKGNKRDWVMNMNGRSYLSVFHEYVRRALQKQPVYEFRQLENASSPYQATVFIGGMQYGVGRGSSKRQAKSAAARASIHILIPEMRDELERAVAAAHHHEPDFSFFDSVDIEDPRITEFCAATCEPSPHAILRTCLLRNFGATDTHIQTDMKKLEYQKIELTMKVGKHSATVVCKNKKTAKQRASQAILQALHPHVSSWGSLLRLYGSRSVKSCKEKKLEEQQITLLQDQARHNEPNHAVLDKLRHEMRRLRERDGAVVPVGTLLLPALPSHSAAALNYVDL